MKHHSDIIVNDYIYKLDTPAKTIDWQGYPPKIEVLGCCDLCFHLEGTLPFRRDMSRCTAPSSARTTRSSRRKTEAEESFPL